MSERTVDLTSGIRDAVERAVAVTRESDVSTENMLRAVYRAVYAYADSQDPDVLVGFARAALATVAVHEAPEYEKALEAAPTRPERAGPPLEDLFAGRLR